VIRRFLIGLLALYALLTLYTVASLGLGIRPSSLLTPLTTLVGFSFAVLHAWNREGGSRALRLVGSVVLVSLLFESIGVATGWIYGPYHYTGKLGPLILGLVPAWIPAAWFMMSYPSFVIADRLIPPWGRRGVRILEVAAIGALAMTAWDLVMDHFMVSAGYWVWDVQGPFFGIPLQNFWGWWLTVFTSLALYLLLAGSGRRAGKASLDRLALGSYWVTALGITALSLISRADALALIGVFAMLPWCIAAWPDYGTSEIDRGGPSGPPRR
jgi:putative membrane protein